MRKTGSISNNLTPSLEDYLEAILIISKEKKIARVKDIAEHLKVRTASVVGALKILEKKGYVSHERYGYVELTEEGKKIASEVYRRHLILKEFFIEVLDLPEKEAEENACAIEHHLTSDAVDRFLAFINFIKGCPNEIPFWLKSFKYYLYTGKRPEECGKGKVD